MLDEKNWARSIELVESLDILRNQTFGDKPDKILRSPVIFSGGSSSEGGVD